MLKLGLKKNSSYEYSYLRLKGPLNQASRCRESPVSASCEISSHLFIIITKPVIQTLKGLALLNIMEDLRGAP